MISIFLKIEPTLWKFGIEVEPNKKLGIFILNLGPLGLGVSWME